MWIAVRPRFSKFLENLKLKEDEVARGLSRYESISGSLNRAYYGGTDQGPKAKIIGSWAKGTAISPSVDVDIYYQLPASEYLRFTNYVGNGQSALLSNVRDHLLSTYPQTQVSGDGQVVVVAFNNLPTIEVAPSFLRNDGRFVLPNSPSGGSWITADPDAERSALDIADLLSNNNARSIVKMAKCWKRHCNVPIKSFHLELLVCQFLPECEWRSRDVFYYDWIVRDFFSYLIRKVGSQVFAPGTLEAMNVGDAWYTRAETALRRAEKACEYEYDDWVHLAGAEWQKIFGEAIPEGVS